MKSIITPDQFRPKTPISFMHLTPPSYNLSARNFQVVRKLFEMLDFTSTGIDDVVFKHFIRAIFYEEKAKELHFLFSLFDTNLSYSIDFDEFYLLIQILIAIRDNQIRQFFKANTRICFDLLDSECLGMITKREQSDLSFLLNMCISDVIKKFNDHDTSKNEALDFEEFKILVLDCLDNNGESQNSDSDEGTELSDEGQVETSSFCQIC